MLASNLSIRKSLAYLPNLPGFHIVLTFTRDPCQYVLFTATGLSLPLFLAPFIIGIHAYLFVYTV